MSNHLQEIATGKNHAVSMAAVSVRNDLLPVHSELLLVLVIIPTLSGVALIA